MILEDRTVRAKLVQGARSLAADHDIKRTAMMLKELYESLVSGGVAR